VTDELLFLLLFLVFPLRLDNQAIARDSDLEVFFLDTGDVGAYDELNSVKNGLLKAYGSKNPSIQRRGKAFSKNSSMLWVNGLIALPASCSFFGKMLRTLGIRSPPLTHVPETVSGAVYINPYCTESNS
jgi:hypothetical protein